MPLRPLLLLDLAVPRDIDPRIGGDDVFLYTVDDFDELVKANLATREKEARRAEQIVGKHVDEYQAGMIEHDLHIGQLLDLLDRPLSQAFRRLGEDDAVRVIVVTGAGRAFSTRQCTAPSR